MALVHVSHLFPVTCRSLGQVNTGRCRLQLECAPRKVVPLEKLLMYQTPGLSVLCPDLLHQALLIREQ